MPMIWPEYQFLPGNNAVIARPKTAVSWTRKLGGKINGGLAIQDGVLFVESFDKRVTALDARTGAVKWSTQVDNVVMTSPVVADGLVVVGTGTNQILRGSWYSAIWGRPQGDAIIALDVKTGRIVWRYRTVGEDMPSPALARVNGEYVVIWANGDHHVRAVRLRDGHLLWQIPAGISTMSSATVDRGFAYVLAGHRTWKIDPATGRVAWQTRVGNPDCGPTFAYNTVFVEGSEAGMNPNAAGIIRGRNEVDAVDAGTGKIRWHWQSARGAFTQRGSNEQAIAGMAAGGTLYQAVPATSTFVAFDARTGRIRWRLRTAAPVKMSAVEKNGRLYFGDTGHTFYTVDARTGRVVDRRVFPDFFSTSPPVIVGNTLYIANDDTLRAMRI